MNAQLRPATLTDNELRATIYFAVGVASEGSSRGRNVAYELVFAGFIHREGDMDRRRAMRTISVRLPAECAAKSAVSTPSPHRADSD